MYIEQYNESLKEDWDELVRQSRNGTFLFYRDYMGYHSDRDEDHSLLIRDNKKRLVALLPANKKGKTLISHGGLTYGGFVTDERMKTSIMLEIFEKTRSYLNQLGFGKLVYKAIPYIYHRIPSEEDNYALFRNGAILYRRDLTTTVIPSLETRLQERRLRSVKKARKAGVTCKSSEDYRQFWSVLEHNLHTGYNRKPVHSLDEIQLLHSLFPENIKLFGAFIDNNLVAGVLVYETYKVAHTQYIASSDEGRKCGALDLLFFHLITERYRNKPYLDFGISTESEGKYLNQGLVDYKEGFGGRAVMYDSYEINLIE